MSASLERAEASAKEVTSTTSGGVPGIVCTYLRGCSMVQLEAVSDIIKKRMLDAAIDAEIAAPYNKRQAKRNAA